MSSVKAIVKVFDSNGVCCGVETVIHENADWIIEDSCLTIVRHTVGRDYTTRLASYPANDWKKAERVDDVCDTESV